MNADYIKSAESWNPYFILCVCVNARVLLYDFIYVSFTIVTRKKRQDTEEKRYVFCIKYYAVKK